MKLFTGIVLSSLILPAFAGTIRHDTPDAEYQGFGHISDFSPVGMIIGQADNGYYGCSGTAISKYLMVTAAHCVNEAKAIEFYLEDKNGNFSAYKGTSWEANQNFNIQNLYAGWDIGLVHFDQALDVTPAQIYRGSQDVGNIGAIVGYGTTGNGVTGTVGGFGVKRAGLNLLSFAFSTEGNGQQILFGDFDPPADNNPLHAHDTFGDGFALPYEYSPSHGDSGGGTFIYDGGQSYLAGITSFGADINRNGLTADYGDYFGLTRVSSFSSWLDQEIAKSNVPESSGFILFLTGLLGIRLLRKK